MKTVASHPTPLKLTHLHCMVLKSCCISVANFKLTATTHQATGDLMQANGIMFPVKRSLFLLLFFPTCTFELCTDGTPKECQDAGFAPGSNLAGEGFDITSMERKGAFVLDMNQWKRKDQACTLCSNPYMKNRKQKLPLSVVDWRPTHSCNAKVSSRIYKSSESLVKSTTSLIENNWKVDLDLTNKDKSGSLMFAGTHSKLAGYSMDKTKSDKFSFTTQGASCEYYSYRVSKAPTIQKEFLDSVNQLPKVYNPQSKATTEYRLS
ncbi:hypothetical protein OJAV_G00082350 [Oryzias javanicus]|uniref:MACPF domain-containing protein n=1 Tax=Oryzias javanicus TaxID=123683 RepID=A0A3S2UFP0_ORYJA|nr:hypothetical protein OJAV_G00082350 [Oryzias javanicus]